MSTFKGLVLAGLLLGSWAHADELGPGLGEPVSHRALSEMDFTVLPNGDGLPAGQGTALLGSALYDQHCASCHGEAGVGGANAALVGGVGSLDTDRPLKTVGSFWPYAPTIFDYVRRSMPYPSPGILTDSEVYSVTAYLLFLNGMIKEDVVVSATTLPRVNMPNRDGFVLGER
ncbi:MAG: hypothetical protein CL917_08110 [Deltaproteobacteria bacterium]|nr:hypothetical protein [Deltaproteobacteria bacterium]